MQNHYIFAAIVLFSVFFGVSIKSCTEGTMARDERQELLRVIHYTCLEKSPVCEQTLKDLEKFQAKELKAN